MENDTEYQRTKEYLKGKLPMYLRSKNINLNTDFNCLNPQHQDHDHSMHYEKQSHTVNCSRCNARYDIFDIVGMDYHLDSFDQRFNKVHEMYIGPVPDELNKDQQHINFGKSTTPTFQDRFSQNLMMPNQDRRLIVPQALMDMQQNRLNASAMDRLEAQRKNSRQGSGNARPQTGINAQRQYSTSFGPQSQMATVQRTINLNPNGTVASVQTKEVSGKGINKPQPRFKGPVVNSQESALAGITTISLSREEAKQLSESGASRLGQLPASLAQSIRASDQAKRQQMQEQAQSQAQERKRQQEMGQMAFGPDHLGERERLEPTFKIPQDLEMAAEGATFQELTTQGTEPSFGDGAVEQLEIMQEHIASQRANQSLNSNVFGSNSFGDNAHAQGDLSPIQALAQGQNPAQINRRKSIHPQIQEISASQVQNSQRGSKFASGMSSGRGVATDNLPSADSRNVNLNASTGANTNTGKAFDNGRAFPDFPPFVTQGTPKFKTSTERGISNGTAHGMNAGAGTSTGGVGVGTNAGAGAENGNLAEAGALGKGLVGKGTVDFGASGASAQSAGSGKGAPNFFASAQVSSAAQATGAPPSLSSQVNKRYDELWADFDKAHLEKQQAAAKAAIENEQRRQREEEYSKSLQQFQYQRPNTVTAPISSTKAANPVSEDEDSPYLAPNQNIQEFEKAKAQRQALSQQAQAEAEARAHAQRRPNGQNAQGTQSSLNGLFVPDPRASWDESDQDDGTVTGNVTPNDDPLDHRALGTRSQDLFDNARQATGHARTFNKPESGNLYAFGPSGNGIGRAGNAGNSANAGNFGNAGNTGNQGSGDNSDRAGQQAVGNSGEKAWNQRPGRSDKLSPEMANSPIAGMMEQLNGTSNGSMSNGNSRQGKATSAIFNTATASQSWKQVFGDAELPLLNPTAPSTLINGRSYNFEQMDEKTLRNRIEQNLASDTARITAENARIPHSLYESAKGRPEQPSTHIFGSAVDGKTEPPQLNTSRPSSGDPYTVGNSLSAMVSASMAAAQKAGASAGSMAGAGIGVSAGLGGAGAGRESEVSTVIQRTPLAAQRTPSGALVGSTAEVHSTPSIAAQIQNELNKKNRINEQNTRIFGTLNKVEQPPEEELNTRISVSNRHTPPMQDKLPPLDTSNPYSTTILSGVMKDKLMPKQPESSGSDSTKKVHRGPKIDFSNVTPLSQDSTLTTSTSHSAQIDFTQLERDRVSTLNAQLNKPAEKVSTPLNFFARAQDAIDDPELKNKAVLVDEYGVPTNLDTKDGKSKLSPEKLKEFAQLATLPSLEEFDKKGTAEDALDRLAKVTQQASSESSKKLETAEDLNDALAKTTAAISAAATIKAAYVSLDKDLEKLGLKDTTKGAAKDAKDSQDSKGNADKLRTTDLTGDAVKEFKISLDSIDSFLDASALKSAHKDTLKDTKLAPEPLNKGSERMVKDDFKVKPEDKLPPLHLSPEEKDRALKMGIELLQAQDLLKDPSLLPPNTRVISGNKGRKVGREQDALDIIQELLATTDSAPKSKGASEPQAADTHVADTDAAKAQPQALAQTNQAKSSAQAVPNQKQAQATAVNALVSEHVLGSEADHATTAVSSASRATTPDAVMETAPSSAASSVSVNISSGAGQTDTTPAQGAGAVSADFAMSATQTVSEQSAQSNLSQMLASQPLSPNALATPGLSPNIANAPLVGMPGLIGMPAAMPSVQPMQPVPQFNQALAQVMGMQPNNSMVPGTAPTQSQGALPTPAQVLSQAQAQSQVAMADQLTGTDQMAGSGINTGAEEFWCKTMGLSQEVVERFNLSYLPQLPVGTQVWSAAIIPLGYECQQVLNTKTGQSIFMCPPAPCFNLDVLPQGSEGLANALFIVSSPLDALSLESLGAHAMALVQTDNANRLLEFLQENLQQTQPFYIALERSSAWSEVAQHLCWGFNALQLPFKLIELAAPYATINQALLQDKSGLLSKLQNPEVLNSLVIAPPAANGQANTQAPGSALNAANTSAGTKAGISANTPGNAQALGRAEGAENATANQFTPIQLLEVFAPMKDSGFILSTDSLAKLQLANVLYTVTTTNVAISRLILSSIMLNQAPILFAGSKMQWQMLCNRLATLPVGGVLTANNNNTVVVGSPDSTDLVSGIAPQPCNARLVELPLEFDTKSLLITLTQAVMTARNSLPNFGSLRLMLDTYSFEERFCAALAPLLAELALSLNLPIMVWCTLEQRRYFEGQSVQTIEITKGMDNEVIFKTLDQDCHLHTFRSLPR